MSTWAMKRFWQKTEIAEEDRGFAVHLDGRAVRTPAKLPLLLPSRTLAQMVAEEWDAQTEAVDPTQMPTTRMANAAIDKVSAQHGEVADMLAAYGGTDLLCYRADSPQELTDRQAELWDPALVWARKTLGVKLAVGHGVIHIPHDEQQLTRLSARVHALDEFRLAAFHDLVSLSGSLVLGFATTQGWQPADRIWELSRLDENWQQEQWGEDEEAMEMAEVKRMAFLHADRFFANC